MAVANLRQAGKPASTPAERMEAAVKTPLRIHPGSGPETSRSEADRA